MGTLPSRALAAVDFAHVVPCKKTSSGLCLEGEHDLGTKVILLERQAARTCQARIGPAFNGQGTRISPLIDASGCRSTAPYLAALTGRGATTRQYTHDKLEPVADPEKRAQLTAKLLTLKLGKPPGASQGIEAFTPEFLPVSLPWGEEHLVQFRSETEGLGPLVLIQPSGETKVLAKGCTGPILVFRLNDHAYLETNTRKCGTTKGAVSQIWLFHEKGPNVVLSP